MIYDRVYTVQLCVVVKAVVSLSLLNVNCSLTEVRKLDTTLSRVLSKLSVPVIHLSSADRKNNEVKKCLCYHAIIGI